MSTNVIWANTVDQGAWQCEVVRDQVNERVGHLKVVRSSDGAVILNIEVPLSYGAVFGPDVDDVADWQDKILNAIDSV